MGRGKKAKREKHQGETAREFRLDKKKAMRTQKGARERREDETSPGSPEHCLCLTISLNPHKALYLSPLSVLKN